MTTHIAEEADSSTMDRRSIGSPDSPILTSFPTDNNAAMKPSASMANSRISSEKNNPTEYFAFWSMFPAAHPVLSHSLLCSILLLLTATNSLPVFQSLAHTFLSHLSLILLRLTFLLTAVFSLLHQTGALRHYAIHFAENELSKVMNRTLVTISDIQVDVWRGKVVVQDLVVHNKDRIIWEWESPCLARVGRIEATLNFTSVIEIPFYGPILNHKFKDIFTGLVEDVQVFVEKRRNVFNFHLLDGDLDIPDPKLIMEEFKRRKGMLRDERTSAIYDSLGTEGESLLTISKSLSVNTDDDRHDMSVGSRDGNTSLKDKVDEATLIVEKLVGAVSNLGKAATDGGSKALHSALLNQRENLVKSMKMLHLKNSTFDGSTEGSSVTKRAPKKDRVAESVSVIRQLGKVIEQNVSEIKDQMSFLQKPPMRKVGSVKNQKSMDNIRIGSFLLREMRIFTKDVLASRGYTNASSMSNIETENRDGNSSINLQDNVTVSEWSSPILIWELAISGAEFSPPMSARDPSNGLPLVGIPINRAVDIILKRLMTEAAKSNTGRLLQTAFGDVFSFINVANQTNFSAKSGERYE